MFGSQKGQHAKHFNNLLAVGCPRSGTPAARRPLIGHAPATTTSTTASVLVRRRAGTHAIHPHQHDAWRGWLRLRFFLWAPTPTRKNERSLLLSFLLFLL